MKLNQLADRPGSARVGKRLGRGPGSGKGKTAGRGHKGQTSRSGVAIKGFEGGQMPIHRRLPKRGFNNVLAKTYNVVNIGRVQAAIEAGRLDDDRAVDLAMLIQAGLVGKPRDGVRLLGKGKISARLNFVVNGASRAAVAAVEAAGGSVEIIAARRNISAQS